MVLLRAIRLGRTLVQRGPVHHKWERASKVDPSSLSGEERAQAAAVMDMAIPSRQIEKRVFPKSSGTRRLVRDAAGLVVLIGALGMCIAGCGSGSSGGSAPNAHRTHWVDQTVSFAAGGMTVYGTYRHPAAPSGALPAVLLIAGSGPTDRNGNSRLDAGSVDTLRKVADWLSTDGVASLRYDKLGTGRTGLGPYAVDPSAIGIMPYEQEAAAALRFLARQPGVEQQHIGVIGHSEGALFALLLASRVVGPAPRLHAIGLLEPLSMRELDVLAVQLRAQLDSERAAGRITPSQRDDAERLLDGAIGTLRATGTLPADLPTGLSGVLPASSARFLGQTDRYDPAVLAAHLPARMSVLVTCSNADFQATCPEVGRVLAGLARAGANTDFVRLSGVDHVLKQDATRSAANYTAPLPFSTQLQSALGAFVDRSLF